MNPFIQRLKKYGTLSLQAEQDIEKRTKHSLKRRMNIFLNKARSFPVHFLPNDKY
jgi:hypothetical protein